MLILESVNNEKKVTIILLFFTTLSIDFYQVKSLFEGAKTDLRSMILAFPESQRSYSSGIKEFINRDIVLIYQSSYFVLLSIPFIFTYVH